MHFFYVKRLCFVFVVIIGMSPNSPEQIYFPKDNYKQKQCDTLPVSLMTGIMHFNRLLWWLLWHRRLIFVVSHLDK